MQSYIGVFYHILLHRDFKTLRQVLIQRLIVSLVRKEFLVSFLYFRFDVLLTGNVLQVLENLMENSLPYLKYSYRKYGVRYASFIHYHVLSP